MQFVDSYIVPCLVYELSIVLSDMEIPEVGATFMPSFSLSSNI